MRLVSFAGDAGARLGALTEDGSALVDIGARDRAPASMSRLLWGGSEAWSAVRAESSASAAVRLSLEEARLLAPVPDPGMLVCIGYNYFGHGDEDGAVPDHPDVFAKAPQSIIGPGDAIRLPPESNEVDYEGELAVVIGSHASRVREADALSHVAGYTILNDVSARDVQAWGSQWTLGKSFDTFGPMGPWLTTADEVPDPQALDITVECHGEVTVRSHTSRMIRSVAWLVSHVSRAIALRPGDVIATGTPGKLPGPAASGRSLSPGDTVSITYGHLGTLTSPVVSHSFRPESMSQPQER
ncbi:fumarylacetoacetate hydrolase family protein [Demequina muriae]|uniref:Fumarylacetoacetate hydrolase family protein n=1 Tax=Demequina muriae TaxID=3051664 RepID=A0ABT8GFZ2_9MICO|nr:fumarylacetoacetate hydrolase family protein [Demequina sp. EGI L300058]MDN4479866.1 fumarylacetoacetate hydrolase family protein [Demequina sp. EGI L300058]